MLNSSTEVQRFMPHSGEMVLLDRVTEYSLEHIVTELDISPRLPCYTQQGVPAYLGIEVMAQSVAAWSGLRRDDVTSPPPIGYLLGTRKFTCSIDYFSANSTIVISAHQILENEGMSAFSCKLSIIENQHEPREVANADISVYSTSWLK